MIASCYYRCNSNLHVLACSKLLSNYGMENKQIRRQNLLALESQFGTLEMLAEETDTVAGHLSQIKNNTRKMGDKVARRIEDKLDKERGWMDRAHGAELSIEDPMEAQLLRMYRELPNQEARDRILGSAQRIFTEEKPGKSAANPFGGSKVTKPVAKKKPGKAKT